MKARELRKNMPEEWASVEEAVWDTMKLFVKNKKIAETINLQEMTRVAAYNAAFIACCFLHTERKTGASKCLKSKLKNR